jgi:hypothetical protein
MWKSIRPNPVTFRTGVFVLLPSSIDTVGKIKCEKYVVFVVGPTSTRTVRSKMASTKPGRLLLVAVLLLVCTMGSRADRQAHRLANRGASMHANRGMHGHQRDPRHLHDTHEPIDVQHMRQRRQLHMDTMRAHSEHSSHGIYGMDERHTTAHKYGAHNSGRLSRRQMPPGGVIHGGPDAHSGAEEL